MKSGIFDDCLTDHHRAVESWKLRRHLLNTDTLSKQEVDCVMALAAECKKFQKTFPAPLSLLSSKVVANFFFENSTRTRTSFELAARLLGATVLNLDVGASSTAKGETMEDTARTLAAMGAHLLIVRHKSSGAPANLAAQVGDRASIVSAGDGWNAHPTQALLDLFTMREVMPDLNGAKITILGDITHSRVARSNIWLLKQAGADLNLAGPPTLMPAEIEKLGVTVHESIDQAVADADFIMVLRLQLERQKQGLLPSIGEYKMLYRLDHLRLLGAKKHVRVLHPGPVNRGIEITDELAQDQKYSLIDTQVTNGVAVRMAVLHLLLAGK